MTPRQIALGAGLAATVAATAWLALSPEEEAVVATAGTRREAVSRADARAVAASAPATQAASTWPIRLVAEPREAWPAPADPLFAAWSPPPPPPPPPAPPPPPPPPPRAPNFPYQLMGRMEEGGVAQALLSGPLRSFGVRAGDVVDGQWRVEQVSATGVKLVWIPGGLPQTLSFKPS
nr:hypothetical protein [uncultured Roseateles sp.]